MISAQSPLVDQKILDEVRKHDPTGRRTIGIITKPDLVERGSPHEQVYLRLARNEDPAYNLALGWHVLRNRSHSEASFSSSRRDKKELQFFSSGTWSCLGTRNCGVGSLRDKLGHAILGHFRATLQDQIAIARPRQKSLEACLQQLGSPRSSLAEMRRYLGNLGSQFHHLAAESIRGNYIDGFFGDPYPESSSNLSLDRRVKRLRAMVRDANQGFLHTLATRGEKRRITWSDGDVWDDISSLREWRKTPPTSNVQLFADLYSLSELVFVSMTRLRTEVLSEYLCAEYQDATNDQLGLALFRKQSEPWGDIANQHVGIVLSFVRLFIEHLMNYIAGPGSTVRDAVLQKLVDPYLSRKELQLRSKVEELLQHSKTGVDPQPLDTSLLSSAVIREGDDGLGDSRSDRIIASMLVHYEVISFSGPPLRQSLT